VGKKITKNWKIGVNGNKIYTTITARDTSNCIVKVDNSSKFYVFYNNKSYVFSMADILKRKNQSDLSFCIDFEYDLTIALPKTSNVINAYHVYIKNKAPNAKLDSFGLKSPQQFSSKYDYNIYLIGNVFKNEKNSRKYVQLKYKP
jgi:hypothetical protein